MTVGETTFSITHDNNDHVINQLTTTLGLTFHRSPITTGNTSSYTLHFFELNIIHLITRHTQVLAPATPMIPFVTTVAAVDWLNTITWASYYCEAQHTTSSSRGISTLFKI